VSAPRPRPFTYLAETGIVYADKHDITASLGGVEHVAERSRLILKDLTQADEAEDH
jgi:hypothetical protein